MIINRVLNVLFKNIKKFSIKKRSFTVNYRISSVKWIRVEQNGAKYQRGELNVYWRISACHG